MNAARTSQFTDFINMAKRREYLIIDTETTGLHEGEICSIAIIDHLGKPLIDTLVKTVKPIPLEASQIHHITTARVQQYPTWKEIVQSVMDTIQGRDVIVYNAVYDRRMFHQSDEMHYPKSFEWKLIANWHCAMIAYAEYFGEWNAYRLSYTWQTLTNACHQQELPAMNAHSALGDCVMTMMLVERMLATS